MMTDDSFGTGEGQSLLERVERRPTHDDTRAEKLKTLCCSCVCNTDTNYLNSIALCYY